MPPSLSKGGIRNEKGSGKAAANEPMSEPKRRRTAASTDHVRPASLEMFHVKHPFALAKERAFGLGLRARGSRSPGTQGPGCRLAAHGFGLGSRAANQGSRLAGRALANLGLRALPERGGGYPSKCSAATSS